MISKSPPSPNEAALIARVQSFSKSTPQRMQALIAALRYLDDRNVMGDLVECGVYQGANTVLMRAFSPDRMCWLYDTFAGMTEPSAEDGPAAAEKFKRKNPWLMSPLDEVRTNLVLNDVYDLNRMHFVVGDVRETLRELNNLPSRIALLLLDTDFYDSTRVELATLYPMLAPGGVLIIDDYGYWAGARKATDEFFDGIRERPQWTKIDGTAITMVKT